MHKLTEKQHMYNTRAFIHFISPGYEANTFIQLTPDGQVILVGSSILGVQTIYSPTISITDKTRKVNQVK